MKVGFSDLVAIISAGIAVLALFVALYAAYVSQRVATSDFRVSENIKEDTAELVSVLRSIMVKGVTYSQQPTGTRDDVDSPDYIKIDKEKEMLHDFLRSPTALAYYAYASRKSELARQKDEPEKWRTFFLTLLNLSQTNNQWSAAIQASRFEREYFDDLSEQDIEEISSYLSDLPKGLRQVVKGREHDILLSALDSLGERDDARRQHFPEFVKYLRETRKVSDPDLDMFWAVFNNDTNLLEEAIAKGADITATDSAIIKRYKNDFDEFMKSRG